MASTRGIAPPTVAAAHIHLEPHGENEALRAFKFDDPSLVKMDPRRKISCAYLVDNKYQKSCQDTPINYNQHKTLNLSLCKLHLQKTFIDHSTVKQKKVA